MTVFHEQHKTNKRNSSAPMIFLIWGFGRRTQRWSLVGHACTLVASDPSLTQSHLQPPPARSIAMGPFLGPTAAGVLARTPVDELLFPASN